MSLMSVIRGLFGAAAEPAGQALAEVQTAAPESGARAQVGMLRRELATHPSQGLTPARLYAILQEAERGDLRGQHALAADMEEKDPQIQSDLGKRRQAAADRDWQIVAPPDATPAEQRATDQAREVFAGLEVEDLLIELGDGILHGWVNLVQPWTTDGSARVIEQPQWVPHTHFQGHPDAQDTLTLRDGSRTGEALWPLGWVEHRHRAKSGYVARMGLLRVLCWPFLFQNYALGDLAELLEILGIPVRLGKYPAQGTSKAQQATLLRAITGMGHTAAGIIPDTMTVELLEAASGSEKPFETMLNWCERVKSKAVLGGTLTTGADQGSGAYALGRVHERGLDSLIASDCRQYSGTIRRCQLWPMAALNFGVMRLARAPRLVIDTGDPADLTALAEALPKLVSVGVQIPERWVHEQGHIPQALDGEAVLRMGGPAPADPAPAGETAPVALAALTATPPGADFEPALLARLTAAGQPAIEAMLAQIRTILGTARDLDEAAALLEAAFPQVDATALTAALTDASLVAYLMGRADVIGETR